MQAHTGLKRKDMFEAIRKAVKPVSIDLDAKDAITKTGERFSFGIMLTLVFRFFTLAPTKNAPLGSIIVGVPVSHLFYVKRTGMCGRVRQMEAIIPHWAGEIRHADQHHTWFENEYEHTEASNERHKKRDAARNAKKGIRIKPREE